MFYVTVYYEPMWKSWGLQLFVNGVEEYNGYFVHTKKEAIDWAMSLEPDAIKVYTKDFTKYKTIDL